MAQFQFQVGDDGAEVGVAAALAVSVDAALHVRGAGFHRSQCIGHCHVGIVVGMDAQDAIEALAHLGEDLARRPVSVPPLVSQRQSTSAPAFCAASSVRSAKAGFEV